MSFDISINQRRTYRFKTMERIFIFIRAPYDVGKKSIWENSKLLSSRSMFLIFILSNDYYTIASQFHKTNIIV